MHYDLLIKGIFKCYNKFNNLTIKSTNSANWKSELCAENKQLHRKMNDRRTKSLNKTREWAGTTDCDNSTYMYEGLSVKKMSSALRGAAFHTKEMEVSADTLAGLYLYLDDQ